MAIHKRSYAPYEGALTRRPGRFLVLTRYSFQRIVQSKLLMLFLALCLVYPIGCLAFIYLAHNPTFLALISFRAGPLTAINGRFFYFYCVVQGTMAYLLTALVGPSLISPDLVNWGLPLYLCRPLSRAEYVAGKLCVLAFMLSLITWIPGLILYGAQASLGGWDWVRENEWLAGSIFVGSVTWIFVLSFIALALSAWVRWQIAAGALVLAVFVGGAGAAAAANNVLHTTRASYIDLSDVMRTIWADLFRYDSGTDMVVSRAWMALLAVCILAVLLLARRLRAFEVVK